MLNKPFFKILSLYLIVAVCVLSLPASGWAMFLPAQPGAATRPSDIAKIQTTLESEVIKQRLQDYGLSPEEAIAKLNSLSDEQVSQLASQMDSLQPGEGVVGAVIFLLLVALIVIVVLQATGHKVIIRK